MLTAHHPSGNDRVCEARELRELGHGAQGEFFFPSLPRTGLYMKWYLKCKILSRKINVLNDRRNSSASGCMNKKRILYFHDTNVFPDRWLTRKGDAIQKEYKKNIYWYVFKETNQWGFVSNWMPRGRLLATWGVVFWILESDWSEANKQKKKIRSSDSGVAANCRFIWMCLSKYTCIGSI